MEEERESGETSSEKDYILTGDRKCVLLSRFPGYARSFLL
jgi:hypothetical protein